MEESTIKVSVVAGVVIKKDNKYLLVQEKKPNVYGLWNLPAGRVDIGEKIEEAAVREAKEETGFEVKLLRKIDIYQDKATDAVKHAFEAEIIGGSLKYPKEEMLGADWFSLSDIEKMKDKLRRMWVLEAIYLVEDKK